MADKTAGLVQGTLDMLILKTLALAPMHGYGIAIRIERISKGVFRVNSGPCFRHFATTTRQLALLRPSALSCLLRSVL